MATTRKTIHIGRGNGIQTQQLTGNAGCIHPITPSGGGAVTMESKMTSGMVDVKRKIKELPSVEILGRGNKKMLEQVLASNNATTAHLDELIHKARREIRAIQIDVNIVGQIKTEVSRSQKKVEAIVEGFNSSTSLTRAIVEKMADSNKVSEENMRYLASESKEEMEKIHKEMKHTVGEFALMAHDTEELVDNFYIATAGVNGKVTVMQAQVDNMAKVIGATYTAVNRIEMQARPWWKKLWAWVKGAHGKE